MTAPFHDGYAPFPRVAGIVAGPVRKTAITTLANGREARNAAQALSRRRYEVGGALIALEEAQAIAAFFEARRGRLQAFRLHDPTDFTSAASIGPPTPLDQPIGVGDGVTRRFALTKAYGDVLRPIVKPLAESVTIAVDGAAQPFALDSATGQVTLASPPASGAHVTAGFMFDVAVRFDVDALQIAVDSLGAVRLGATPLVEVLL